jgi:hypothetical protein
MHRAEPAEPHQLRDAAGVVAVGLDRHRLERIAHVARLQQLDRKPGLAQRRIKPLRQRHAQSELAEPADQGLRLARNLALAHDLAGAINNAHARAFQ